MSWGRSVFFAALDLNVLGEHLTASNKGSYCLALGLEA
jgi:hypothetical protein